MEQKWRRAGNVGYGWWLGALLHAGPGICSSARKTANNTLGWFRIG
jgi:hypothetical protein